jgi:hypothetical protein
MIHSSKVTEVSTFGTGPTTSQVTLPDWNAPDLASGLFAQAHPPTEGARDEHPGHRLGSAATRCGPPQHAPHDPGVDREPRRSQDRPLLAVDRHYRQRSGMLRPHGRSDTDDAVFGIAHGRDGNRRVEDMSVFGETGSVVSVEALAARKKVMDQISSLPKHKGPDRNHRCQLAAAQEFSSSGRPSFTLVAEPQGGQYSAARNATSFAPLTWLRHQNSLGAVSGPGRFLPIYQDTRPWRPTVGRGAN